MTDNIYTNAAPNNVEVSSKNVRTFKRFDLPKNQRKRDGFRMVKDTYMIEYKPSAVPKDYYKMVQASLQKDFASRAPSTNKIREINSRVFTGLVVSIRGSQSIPSLQLDENVVAIHPVRWVPAPTPMKTTRNEKDSDISGSPGLAPHDISGVTQVHQKLRSFGKGVRVSKAGAFLFCISSTLAKLVSSQSSHSLSKLISHY